MSLEKPSSSGAGSVSPSRHSPRLPPLKRFTNETVSPPSSPKQVRRDISPSVLRQQILNWKNCRLEQLCATHRDQATELFYLSNQTKNLAEFSSWKAGAPSNALLAHLELHRLSFGANSGAGAVRQIPSSSKSLPFESAPTTTPVDTSGGGGPLKLVISKATGGAVAHVVERKPPSVLTDAVIQAIASSDVTTASTSSILKLNAEVKPEIAELLLSKGQLSATATDHCVPDSTGEDVKPPPGITELTVSTTTSPSAVATTVVSDTSVVSSKITDISIRTETVPVSSNSLATTSKCSPSPGSAAGRDEMAERAKQEAWVLGRIADLRREGLWSAKKLPKCCDPPRGKAHWDYLLEEMQWLATDFQQERKWKRVACRKLAGLAAKKVRDEENKDQLFEVEKEREQRRISSAIAKEIRQFWINVGKVAEYKAQSLLDEEKKRALDQHLNFIVGETEKYSSWLQESLNRPLLSAVRGPASAPSVKSDADNDVHFSTSDESEDDERTIAKADKAFTENEIADEINALQKEADLDLDDLLDKLPLGYLDNREKSLTPVSNSSDDQSTDFGRDDEDSADDTSNSSSVEDMDFTVPASPEPKSLKDIFSADEGGISVGDTRSEPAKCLEDDIDFTKLQSENSEERQQELAHIAETAERLQPKGYTLETTDVVTKVPFLLKHKLREYQHVGLDWLVTLYDKKLNGILADEMGLGKTIQTIALLAHLACDKSVWGPHLVVVPTTLMLNWEMEFKKWCPAFKILTYYGNPKDRKEKRKGWTKPNAFHVCITSYKLVLQDHSSFRRMRWEYLILDEAQHIKNFKSQRWQLLLNFNTQRRLLLTGTPLQNNLLELWSLMHFLMPHVFQSHRDFKDWFANPLSGMIEGSQEYNESIVRRLHKVLRPFLLRRLKSEVEKQLPKKYEHVVMCSLSKRQRFLYDDFMSRGSTREGLSSGSMMSVLNILMQLRKVCNHPNLFEPRAIISPYAMNGLTYHTASSVEDVYQNSASDVKDFSLTANEDDSCLTYFLRSALAADRKLIEEIDASSGKVSVPAPEVKGFSFEPLERPQIPPEANHVKPSGDFKPSDGGALLKRKLEFVIPSTVAQTINMMHPVMIQVQSPMGVQLIPVMLKPQAASEVCESRPEHLPVFRLVPSGHPDRPPVVQPAGIIPTSSCGLKTMGLGGLGSPATNNLTSAGASMGTDLKGTSLLGPQSQKSATKSASTPSFDASSHSNTIGAKTVLHKTAAEVNSLIAPRWPPRCSQDLASQQRHTVDPAVKRRFFDQPGTPSVKRRRYEWHMETINRLVSENDRRCWQKPLYGSDLIERLTIVGKNSNLLHSSKHRCERLNLMLPRVSASGERLRPLISADSFSYIEHHREALRRFLVYVPRVRSSLPQLHLSHPHPHLLQSRRNVENSLRTLMPSVLAPFHPIVTGQSIQFPEARLIEYDCGKLQTMSRLLVQLHSESHRCLIFTQMTKMLDILEAFLCHHGFKYVRLDGATKIEERQVLMERFNNDTRIFCFILSTRSGGLGVNLTGADTVIFYDSDWNPTMDAQAQDRCHRIGQTRDVHIYRLVCEQTVEQNILKKAQQKRLLGEIAIEEGGFTAEFFKRSNLRDIFGDSAASVAAETASKPLAEAVDEEISPQTLEEMLVKVEDERDVAAAKAAKAEATQEFAEMSVFDDTKPIDEDSGAKVESKVERELRLLVEQLSPVERYALKFLESSMDPVDRDEIKLTEKVISQKKRDWEVSNLIALKKEEEQRQEEADDELLLTYSMDDSKSQVRKKPERKNKAVKKTIVSPPPSSSPPGPTVPGKRGRGRPRKYPRPISPQEVKG